MESLRILMLHRQNSAVGYYRTWVVARQLKKMGHSPIWAEHESFSKTVRPENPPSTKPEEMFQRWLEEQVGNFDLIWADRTTSNDGWAQLAAFRHYSPNCRMIVDFDDDFLNVPDWNPAKQHYHPGQETYEAGLNHLKVAELVTVSTPLLASRFAGRAHAIRVNPNYIDPADWVDLKVDPDRGQDPNLRVLYGGASGHYGDLDDIRKALTDIVEEPPVPFRLICFGALPAWLHDLREAFPGRVIGCPWVPFEDYPQAVAWGGFDLAIAPLKDHPFNESKTNIKFLEAGIQGIPFLCSKVGPYAEIPDGCAIRVSNKPQEWREALVTLLQSKSLRKSLANEAREYVLDTWTIDKNARNLHSILEEALARPRIESLEDTRLPKDRLAAQAAQAAIETAAGAVGTQEPKPEGPDRGGSDRSDPT